MPRHEGHHLASPPGTPPNFIQGEVGARPQGAAGTFTQRAPHPWTAPRLSSITRLPHSRAVWAPVKAGGPTLKGRSGDPDPHFDL